LWRTCIIECTKIGYYGSNCATLKRSRKNYLIAFKYSDMANTLDPMDLKQILTLHLEGCSNRKIGSVLRISRSTVNTYMQLFASSDYSCQELLGFDTVALSELFSSHTTLDPVHHNELMLYFEGVNKARNHPGFTFLYHLIINTMMNK
jgi:hypothetical protein